MVDRGLGGSSPDNRWGRRSFLAAAVAAASGVAGCPLSEQAETTSEQNSISPTSPDITRNSPPTDTPSDTPTSTPKPPRIDPDLKAEYGLQEDRRYSEMEAEAFEYAWNELETVDMWQLTWFLNSTTMQAFRDAQLDYWKNDVEGWDYHREGVGKRDAKTVQTIIVNGGHLLHDDWNATGLPHILPNGDPGPGNTEQPAKPGNPDRDGLMPGFYDHTRTVRKMDAGDTPADWEYLGYQPEKGDKLGKRGDKHGDGSILKYLDDDVTADDIVGHRVAVGLWDRADHATPPDTEWMTDLFADAPLENRDGTTGIDLYHIERAPIQQKEGWGWRDISAHYEESVPAGLQGPAFYTFIGDTAISAVITNMYPPTYAAYINDTPEEQASAQEIAEEATRYCGKAIGHMSIAGTYGPILSEEEDGSDFNERGWKQIAKWMDMERRPYFHHLDG